ncbi:MAG: hypothetical protein V1847_00685 [Candidatus Diapherotrites archaeon]
MAVAFGGKAGRMQGTDEEGKEVRKMEVLRFANRTPLLFDAGGCALTKAVQSVEWKRYGIKDVESAPLTVFIHILSVHIPYTGAGKQAVTDEDEVMEELRLALMDAGRKIFRYIGFVRREQEKQEKRKLYYKYASEVAIAIAEMTGKKKEEVEKKLHDIVLKHLKMEEAREAKALELDPTEEDVEQAFEKRQAREKKESEKKKKGK